GDMLAAAILEIGGLAHHCDGIAGTALRKRDPRAGGLFLDGYLLGPVSFVRLGKPVPERADVLERFLRVCQRAAAGCTDRASEPSDRFRLGEWRLRDRKRGGLGPGGALEGVADRNRRKRRVPAIAEIGRIFGNAVAGIDDALCLLVLAQLQV